MVLICIDVSTVIYACVRARVCVGGWGEGSVANLSFIYG